MPVVQRSEFTLALSQIASERGVDPDVVLDTIKRSIFAAYKKDNEVPEEEEENYDVSLNESTGETRILHNGKDVTPPGFGRIAAQTAKQVLLQQIREREKDAVFAEYSKRIATVVTAHILRFQGPNIIVDIGRTEAIIPPDQKIPNEQYFLNKKIAVYIVDINEDEETSRRNIIVSRSHPGLIEGLLKREVPEVSSGNVVVKNTVREPGSRAKVAVYSEQTGIDPVGSCVGQKGVRIQAVIDALDGLEKIDVIQWNKDPEKYIAYALSPAKEVTVKANVEEKIARVQAPREELPLVIGRDGQNVRLASKLTGYNIDVEGDEEVKAEAAEIAKETDKTNDPEETEEKADSTPESEVEAKVDEGTSKDPSPESSTQDDTSSETLVKDDKK